MLPATLARVPDLALRGALVGWLAATALSQHPNRQFDRLRKYDRSGVALPNWRFFAPEPCTHDFRVLHRTLAKDGTQSHWQETYTVAPRRMSHMFWFPERRRDKGMNDICNELVRSLQDPELDLSSTPAYRVLRDYVQVTLAAETDSFRGFQFLVVADSGYDEDDETHYVFASKFEPWVRDE